MKGLIHFFAAFSLLVSNVAFAASGPELGYMFGVKNADYDIDATGVDTTAQMGFTAGVVATLDFAGVLLRTGGYYAQRKTEIEAGTLSADYAISYIDVPVTILFNMNDSFGFFAGAVVALKASDSCSGDDQICDGDAGDKVKSMHAAATAGLRAKFHPNWAAEMSYELGLNDVAKDVSVNSLSINAQFLY